MTRKLDIPEDAIRKIAPTLEALEEAFRPLPKQLEQAAAPAIILSESAVFGE